MPENKHIGSSFDEFLKKEGAFEEVESNATARVVAWQLAQARKEAHVTKVEQALQLFSGRPAGRRDG